MEKTTNLDAKKFDPIPHEQLYKMHKKYLSKTHKMLSLCKAKDETKSIWFKKEGYLTQFLSEFLASSATGLRIYLCEYDQDTIPGDVRNAGKEHDYIDKLTVGFISTNYDSNTQIEVDDKDETKMLILDPYNHGKICPPDICPEEEGNPMKQ